MITEANNQSMGPAILLAPDFMDLERKDDMKYKTCEDCSTGLVYEADLGAPGKGQSWICPKCRLTHWVYGSTCIPFRDLNPEDVTLTIADVI